MGFEISNSVRVYPLLRPAIPFVGNLPPAGRQSLEPTPQPGGLPESSRGSERKRRPPEKRQNEFAPRRGAKTRGHFREVERAIEVRAAFSASSRRWSWKRSKNRLGTGSVFLRKNGFWHPGGVREMEGTSGKSNVAFFTGLFQRIELSVALKRKQ